MEKLLIRNYLGNHMKKAECQRIDAFELWCWRRLFESPLDCKEIRPVHSKGDQSWVFIGRNDTEAETPMLWPPHAKSWLIGKDSDAGDWGLEEKGTTEDEMAGWHHQLYGHGFGWTLGVGDGQGGLVCCNSWDCKESDTTEWLNRTEWSHGFPYFLQFKSEFGNKEFMIWAIVSSQSCFCWLCRASPSLAAKNIINLSSVLTVLWCPCVESSLELLKESVCSLWSKSHICTWLV